MQMPEMAKDVFIGDPYRLSRLLPSRRIVSGETDTLGRSAAPSKILLNMSIHETEKRG
jgi:hypothetical protein